MKVWSLSIVVIALGVGGVNAGAIVPSQDDYDPRLSFGIFHLFIPSFDLAEVDSVTTYPHHIPESSSIVETIVAAPPGFVNKIHDSEAAEQRSRESHDASTLTRAAKTMGLELKGGDFEKSQKEKEDSAEKVLVRTSTEKRSLIKVLKKRQSKKGKNEKSPSSSHRQATTTSNQIQSELRKTEEDHRYHTRKDGNSDQVNFQSKGVTKGQSNVFTSITKSVKIVRKVPSVVVSEITNAPPLPILATTSNPFRARSTTETTPPTTPTPLAEALPLPLPQTKTERPPPSFPKVFDSVNDVEKDFSILPSSQLVKRRVKKPQRHWTPSVRQQESKFIPSSGPEPHFLPTQTPTVDVSNLLVTDPYKKVYSNDQEYIKDVQSYEPKLIPPTLPRKEIEVNTIDLLNPIILDQGQAPPKASTPAFTGVQKVRNAILVELTGAMREFEDDFGKVTSDDTFHSPDFLSGNPEQLNEPVSRPMSPKRENEEKLSSTPYVAVPKKKTNKRPRHLAAHHQAPAHFHPGPGQGIHSSLYAQDVYSQQPYAQLNSFFPPGIDAKPPVIRTHHFPSIMNHITSYRSQDQIGQHRQPRYQSVVDFGAASGGNGAFGWYSDHPVALTW